jgi:hypothetical protein
MKKLFVSVFAFATLALTGLYAQNNVWSLPPNYYKSGDITPTPLPIPPDAWGGGSCCPNEPTDPTDGYDGQIPQFAHNAMQDANGNLLFFIIDEYIYDKNGYLIQEFWPFGGSELMIVPAIDNCNRYYIFSTTINTTSSNPIYGILDYNPSTFEPINNTTTSSLNVWRFLCADAPPMVICSNYPDVPLNMNTIPNDGYGQFGTNVTKNGILTYAATPLINGNKRYIYQQLRWDTYVYELNSSGLVFKGLIPHALLTSNLASNSGNRTEMELVKLNDGSGNYRMAFSSNKVLGNTASGFFYADINANTGLNIPGTDGSYIYPDAEAYIHGLEFSADGQFLYLAHNKTATTPSSIDVFQFGVSTAPTPVATIPPIEAEDFQNSNIEMGKDGKLYFATNNRLATYNPTTSVWTNNALSISYNINGAFSSVPSMQAYLLPDQIDGMDYSASFTANTECCLTYSSFTTGTDNENYEQSGVQTWNTTSTGNNPFATDIITVRDELVIKTGANITANNLRFEFAPDAKLVVETGATFTVNNCTLTVENTCENSPMWNGVDVMGPSNGQQTTAGRFIANGSTIEHSYWAVHNFKTKTGLLQEEYGPGYRGGVIIATNTTFRNNHRGMVFFDFQNTNGTTGIDDESKFYNCTFVTDALLNKPNLTPSVIMAHLFGVQGVNFYGCDFKNTASYTTIPYVDRGLGIEAYGCLFTVAPMCFDLNCTNQDKGNFTNLTRGIDASSCYGSKVNNTNFTNNWRAMYLNSTNYANITQNNVNVGANSTSWGASYGLYLESCDQYKVENNNFNTNALQNGYCGVYVKNSGTTMNEIYRNTFDKFVISTQAEGINGNGSVDVVDGKGLEFRCNTYTNTTDKDIFVSSGQIKLNHGTCDYPTSPSNNQFSRTANYDIYQVSPPAAPYYLTYVHSQPAGYNITPLIYGERVNRSDCFSPNYLTFSPTTSCPTRIRRSRTVLLEDLDTGREVVATLTSQIDDSNTKGLLILIQSQAGNGDIKDALMAASPYLSDEVLLAYIQSNPPAGNLQQVLMANSPLSDEVLAAAQQQNLPKGIKTIVNNAQTGTSAMQELQGQIAYHKNEVEKIKSEIIRYLLYEDDVEERLREIIAFLNQGDCSASQKQCYLTEFYIANKEYANATQELSALTDNIEDADYIKLFTNIIELEQTADPIQELAQNPAKQQPIIEVAEAAQRKQETARAEVMLKRAKLRNYQETIEVLNGSSLRLTNQEEQETLNSKLVTSNTITVYPNPTSNEVNITHNLNLENGKVTFKVYNMLGVEVLNENLTSTNNEVQLTNLKAGVYFYTVTQNNQAVKTDKLMVK